MDTWIKQSADQPLYPDLDWEKPERKDQAGRLLIMGGNIHGFSSVARAVEVAQGEGIGDYRVLLPDSLRKTLAPFWVDAIFCPSTSSGSFSKDAEDLILQNGLWADGILVTGDLGRNSETAILLDKIITSLRMPCAITKDALDYYIERPSILLDREHTLLIGTIAQMQKLIAKAGHDEPLVYTMPLASMVGTLARFTSTRHASLLMRYETQVIYASDGNVSTTKIASEGGPWRVQTATKAIVGWLHHPTKSFEAITHSVL